MRNNQSIKPGSDISLYKLVVFMSPPNKPGATYTYYSFPKEEKIGMQAVIGGLNLRILQKKHGMDFFYAMIKRNDGSDKVLKTIYGKKYYEVNKPKQSTVKLVVYDRDNYRTVYHPDESETGKNYQYILGSMQQRVLNIHLHGVFNRALFINTENDKEIMRVTGRT